MIRLIILYEVDIKLLEKVISNFEESYKTKPDKKVYEAQPISFAVGG